MLLQWHWGWHYSIMGLFSLILSLHSTRHQYIVQIQHNATETVNLLLICCFCPAAWTGDSETFSSKPFGRGPTLLFPTWAPRILFVCMGGKSVHYQNILLALNVVVFFTICGKYGVTVLWLMCRLFIMQYTVHSECLILWVEWYDAPQVIGKIKDFASTQDMISKRCDLPVEPDQTEMVTPLALGIETPSVWALSYAVGNERSGRPLKECNGTYRWM